MSERGVWVLGGHITLVPWTLPEHKDAGGGSSCPSLWTVLVWEKLTVLL